MGGVDIDIQRDRGRQEPIDLTQSVFDEFAQVTMLGVNLRNIFNIIEAGSASKQWDGFSHCLRLKRKLQKILQAQFKFFVNSFILDRNKVACAPRYYSSVANDSVFRF